ncbi:MAG: 50S ribosomal protein L21 [Proteobacteria bacterium]|nr:50S ribosomal protein L21 [Pseudomonadota bacterium]
MYAIIKTGGKQYKVFPGEVIKVERLSGEKGDAISFSEVLLVKKDDDTIEIGRPVVEGAVVSGKILKQGKGKKILVFKKKRRKDFSKLYGHRQPFTEVMIEEIKA